MTSKLLGRSAGFAALVVVTSCAASAQAFCGSCGGGGGVAAYAPTTYSAAYAPTYTTAYAPVAYTANYGSGGWFPGCCLGRLFGWGSQPTYAVSYAPSYPVSYAPACSTCTNYAPCTTCASPCNTSVQQVSMRPVCATACSSGCGYSDCGSACSGCSSCGGSVVSQAAYQESNGCSTCGAATSGATTVVVPGTQQIVVPSGQQPAGPTSAAPELAPGSNVGPRSTFQNPGNGNGGELQPAPANGAEPQESAPANGSDLENSDANANYFEAPKLYNPNDRNAARVAAPVRNALYERPASYQRASYGRVSDAQARQDSAGWTSASN